MPVPEIALRPAPGRRLMVPSGSTTLDGVPLPASAELPAAGALVPLSGWPHRAIADGDAEQMSEGEIETARKALAKAVAEAEEAASKAAKAAAKKTAAATDPAATTNAGSAG